MLGLLRSLAKLLSTAAFAIGIRRAVVIENLSKAYPNWSKEAVLDCALLSYLNLGQVFLEFLYLRAASRSSIANGLRINNLELVNKEHPDGAILISGHLGNWEWMAMGVGIRLAKPLEVIIKNQKSKGIEGFLNTMRSRFGNALINAGDVLSIYRALRNGKMLAILADQAAPAESASVPFFGREVPTFEGPARLALRTRAPMYLLQPLTRTKAGYECTFHEIEYDDLQEANEENVRELTARHTALLERVIRDKPEMWLWHHRRWKYAAK